MNKWTKVIAILISIVIFLVACASEPEQIEVTRVVEVEVPGENVEVEVTRIVEVEVPGKDVEVEVTRIVEVAAPAVTDSGEESTDSGEESADNGEESTDSGEESADSGEESNDSGEESADSGEESADNGEESNDEGVFQPFLETVEVADGLYSVGNGEVFGAFLVTDEGVVVMDSINMQFATQMLAAVRQVTEQPIELLIYSHNHWDHIAGGQVFKDEGATVLAHGDIQEWLANHPAPNPDVVLPDETWDGDRHDVVLGGKTIELYHFGPSHGEGMTVFRFPEENSIFTVDIVVPKRVGFCLHA